MNALIIDARKVFKTDATRRVYDVSLNPPQSSPVPIEPQNKVEQWQIDAINKAEMERRHLEKNRKIKNFKPVHGALRRGKLRQLHYIKKHG